MLILYIVFFINLDGTSSYPELVLVFNDKAVLITVCSETGSMNILFGRVAEVRLKVFGRLRYVLSCFNTYCGEESVKTFSNFGSVTIYIKRMWKVRFVFLFEYGFVQNGPCLLHVIFIFFDEIGKVRTFQISLQSIMWLIMGVISFEITFRWWYDFFLKKLLFLKWWGDKVLICPWLYVDFFLFEAPVWIGNALLTVSV